MTNSSDRWQSEQGIELAEEVLASLIAGRSLTNLGLGTYEGRIDLRGFQVPSAIRLKRFQSRGWFVEELGEGVRFKGALWENLDLSNSKLQGCRFHESTLRHCVFDGTDCRDWRLWGTSVEDCSFAGAKMRDSAVGTWHEGRRNIWSRVSFARADFRVGVCWSAIFEDCDFSSARLDGVKFEQCALSGCVFSGDLRSVTFDGRELSERPAAGSMTNVDFSHAEFQNVDFRGYDLRTVTLPPDPDLLLVQKARCVAEKSIPMLGAEGDISSRRLTAILKSRLRGPGTENEWAVYNRRDLVKIGGDQLADLAAKVLALAQHDCLADNV
jgi:uncharacterized protein YjbI with pentapeptide repeats